MKETLHELEVRLGAVQRQRHLGDVAATDLRDRALEAMQASLEIIPAVTYRERETSARRRIPRDPDDWPTVAAALVLDAGIWTNDGDFLGCGCPTWTTETLLAELSS